MSASRNFIDLGIILKRYNLGEADRLVTVFTQHHGKLTALAKGVRKLTSRKSPHIEPFVLSKLYFATSRHLPLITQAETIHAYPNAKNNLVTTRLVFHLGELIDKLLPESQPQDKIFTYLTQALEYLDHLNQAAQDKQLKLTARFELRLLEELGFGVPPQSDLLSLTTYIETILDRPLTASQKLS